MNIERPFKQLYFLLFAPFALQVTYLNLYFERRGLTHAEIGTIAAVMSAVAIVAPMLMGQLADRLRHKRAIVMFSGIALALLFPLHWVGAALLVLAPLAAIFSFFRAPQIPLVDAWFLDALAARGDADGDGYSRTRLWGSIGFIVAGTGVPLLLPALRNDDPLRSLVPVFAAFTLLSLLFAARAATIPDPASEEEGHEAPGDWRAVLRLPRMRAVLGVLLLSQVANQAYYVFLSLYLDRIGVRDEFKGMYWSMGVLGEVLLMAAAPLLLAKVGVRGLLLLGIAGRAARALALSFILPPAVVFVAVQPLHALSFAAVHIASVTYLARTVPPRLRATGQTLLAGAVAGIGGVVGGLLAGWVSDLSQAGALGWLTDRQGLTASYLVAGWVQVAVLLAAWLLVREPPRLAPSAGPLAQPRPSGPPVPEPVDDGAATR